MNSKDLIDGLIYDTQQIIQTVEGQFKTLNQNQLYFKNNGWSIIECIEHLNTAGDHYIDWFEKRLVHAKKVQEVKEFKPGFLGNYLTKSMKPKSDGSIPSKMKTLSKFEPLESKLSLSMDIFLKDQYKMLDILEQSRSVDLNILRIPSAIGKIINFKMGDALRFVVAHNQRHIVQAENVLKTIKVPVVD